MAKRASVGLVVAQSIVSSAQVILGLFILWRVSVALMEAIQ